MQGRGAVTMSALENSLWLLPGELRNTLRHLPEKLISEVCEIRLRRGRLPAVTLPDGEHPLLDASAVTAADLARVLELASGASPYAASECLRRGFITAEGGVRVGFCGRFPGGDRGLWNRDDLFSVCIRIPREVKGIGKRFCARPFPSPRRAAGKQRCCAIWCGRSPMGGYAWGFATSAERSQRCLPAVADSISESGRTCCLTARRRARP